MSPLCPPPPSPKPPSSSAEPHAYTILGGDTNHFRRIERDAQETLKAREQIMNDMIVGIQREAIRALIEKVPRGKKFDSSTGMTSTALKMGNLVISGPSGAAENLESISGDPGNGLD